MTQDVWANLPWRDITDEQGRPGVTPDLADASFLAALPQGYAPTGSFAVAAYGYDPEYLEPRFVVLVRIGDE